MPANLWNEAEAARLPALDGLVYRSNLLGRDRTVCNIFGGNTSVKLTETDHLGRDVEVLWVKGSGSDVLTITEQGFAGLRQAEILPLMARAEMSDEEMVAYLSHTVHALDRPRQSIETLLHGFTPAVHVDHTHPDSVISLACLPDGKAECAKVWGDRMVWVGYIRPGFTLSKWIGEGLRDGMDRFVADYEAYFAANAASGDEMTDPYPRVILIPGLGMINTGADANAADISNQLYYRAIDVINGSQAVDRFVSLTPEEAFGIEYWPLELYKLSLKPPPRELAGRVVAVTGGGSGIGRATAMRLATDDAHVAIFDINTDAAEETAAMIEARHGAGRAIAIRCDVTDAEAVDRAMEEAVLAYGGIDILVSNAGIAIAGAIEDTTDADWQRTMDILTKGYFQVSRAAFRVWKRQDMGGSLIYVVSKNAVYAGRNASVYGAAKAAELHLARCLAAEGGAVGIRVNSVLPDAVIQGSGIWDAGWKEARASSYGIEEDELAEFYRQRTTLKVSVTPDHIAEAISFLAGPRASRTTGGALTVDGGVPAAFVR